jgi:UDP-N-acetylglucosamine transferase subunit ALG13
MPRRAGFGEHVDDHQQDLVREFSTAGRIFVANDSATLAAAIDTALSARRIPGSLRPQDPSLLAQLIRSDLEAWSLCSKRNR